MAILSIITDVTGFEGIEPQLIYINTNDSLATITTAGYLTKAAHQGYAFNNQQLAAVNTTTGPVWLQVSITGISPNQVYSLVEPAQAGGATFLGNVQAGQSGTQGYFISYPATASKGNLIVQATANTGNTSTIVTNAAMGQASTITIPDPGAASANFILSALTGAGTQNITSGSLAVTAGALISGLATGGQVGTLTLYPTTTTTGSFNLNSIPNSGNYAIIIQNAAFGQATTITVPDPGTAATKFLLLDSAGTQTIATGNLALAVGNLTVTAGTITASAGNITAGSSGHAGTLTSFPGTAANGSLIIAAVNNAGNHTATLSNASGLAQNTVYTLADPGAATGNIAVTTGATVSGNFVKASGTTGQIIDSGFTVPAADASANADATTIAVPMSSNGAATNSYSNTLVRYAKGTLTLSNLQNMYTTGVELVPAPGANLQVVIHAFGLEGIYGSAAFTNGGAIYLTYGNTGHGTNYATSSTAIPASFLTTFAANQSTFVGGANVASIVTSSAGNAAVCITNASAAFATGTGATANWYLWYSIVPIT